MVHRVANILTDLFGRAFRGLQRNIAGEAFRDEDVDRALAEIVALDEAVVAQVRPGRVAQEPVFAVACIVAVAVARIVVAGFLLPGPYPREWIDVVRVAGMRGGLSLALALAIPPSIPYREAIIDATFAVAIATLAAGSLTLVPAVQRAVRARGGLPS